MPAIAGAKAGVLARFTEGTLAESMTEELAAAGSSMPGLGKHHAWHPGLHILIMLCLSWCLLTMSVLKCIIKWLALMILMMKGANNAAS